MSAQKSDWILVVLQRRPLDRIHIMKSLFLFWHRSKERGPEFFQFAPYLYGPYSLEVYSELRNLTEKSLVIQPRYPIQEWAKYYLTERGRAKAEEVVKRFASEDVCKIEDIVEEISGLTFLQLLEKVYQEAPEFAVNSVVRDVVKR